MKTMIRSVVMGACLIAVTPVFAVANAVPAPLPAQSAPLNPAPEIVPHRTALSGAELAKYQQSEIAKWAKVVKASGARAD